MLSSKVTIKCTRNGRPSDALRSGGNECSTIPRCHGGRRVVVLTIEHFESTILPFILEAELEARGSCGRQPRTRALRPNNGLNKAKGVANERKSSEIPRTRHEISNAHPTTVPRFHPTLRVPTTYGCVYSTNSAKSSTMVPMAPWCP